MIVIDNPTTNSATAPIAKSITTNQAGISSNFEFNYCFSDYKCIHL